MTTHLTYAVSLELATARTSNISLKDQCQVGSLAGAAHLLNYNAGVLRRARAEQKSAVEQKGKSSINDDFQYEYSVRNQGLSILSCDFT